MELSFEKKIWFEKLMIEFWDAGIEKNILGFIYNDTPLLRIVDGEYAVSNLNIEEINTIENVVEKHSPEKTQKWEKRIEALRPTPTPPEPTLQEKYAAAISDAERIDVIAKHLGIK